MKNKKDIINKVCERILQFSPLILNSFIPDDEYIENNLQITSTFLVKTGTKVDDLISCNYTYQQLLHKEELEDIFYFNLLFDFEQEYEINPSITLMIGWKDKRYSNTGQIDYDVDDFKSVNNLISEIQSDIKNILDYLTKSSKLYIFVSENNLNLDLALDYSTLDSMYYSIKEKVDAQTNNLKFIKEIKKYLKPGRKNLPLFTDEFQTYNLRKKTSLTYSQYKNHFQEGRTEKIQEPINEKLKDFTGCKDNYYFSWISISVLSKEINEHSFDLERELYLLDKELKDSFNLAKSFIYLNEEEGYILDDLEEFVFWKRKIRDDREKYQNASFVFFLPKKVFETGFLMFKEYKSYKFVLNDIYFLSSFVEKYGLKDFIVSDEKVDIIKSNYKNHQEAREALND